MGVVVVRKRMVELGVVGVEVVLSVLSDEESIGVDVAASASFVFVVGD